MDPMEKVLCKTIAAINAKIKPERWHQAALSLHWQWAGHAARRPDGPQNSVQRVQLRPRVVRPVLQMQQRRGIISQAST